ncbi:hypothetical protein ACR789_26045 [Sphingobacterium siyangense]|uniref:hypothetical protein n=1 Tax=Sphingobacterium siyangense TaxID=459529 RepID=UPI003DA2EBD0
MTIEQIVSIDIDRYISNLLQLANDYINKSDLIERINPVSEKFALLKEWDKLVEQINSGAEIVPAERNQKPKTKEIEYLEKRLSKVRQFEILNNSGGFELPDANYLEWFDFSRQSALQSDIGDLVEKIENSVYQKTVVIENMLHDTFIILPQYWTTA